MADDAEDVLELDTDLELDVLDEEDGEETDTGQTDGEVAEDEAEQDFDFGDEGAAPAQESSVIRDLRKANRELAKTIRQYERGNQPQAIEIGPKPTLASCDYDEERFEAELDNWKAIKAQADRAEQEAEQRAEAERKAWEGIRTSYEADKASLKVSNYADAEEEVFAALSEQHQALLMKSGKGAALVVALHRNPDRLQELSEMNLADAAMMIGELRGKVQMKTRQTATPERRVTGNAGFAGGSGKQLARLEKEAERTGDRTKLIRYRKQLAQRAKS